MSTRSTRITRSALLVLACGLALTPTAALGQSTQPPPGVSIAGEDLLPIRRITLYRSGVGSFERRAKIDGDAKVQLRFNTDKINDILKSMIVLDLSGQGSIDGVSYSSKEPLGRRLASFGVNLSDEPPLGTILARLRGTPVSATMQSGTTVKGLIVGGETREQAQGNAQKPIAVPHLNILTDSGIQSINLLTTTSIKIDDPQIQAELTKALGALAEYRADTTKVVDIALRGGQGRDVVVNYVHEMPVWKASYRLVLPDPSPGEKPADKPGMTLQGWAHVENTTDSDWNNVQLALVSGRPVSFTMDLYEPLFMGRPSVPVPTIAGVAPREYELGTTGFAGVAVAKAPGSPPPPAAREPGGPAMRARLDNRNSLKDAAGERARASTGVDMLAGDPASPVTPEDMAQYAARAQALAQESGEVFQYVLQAPVTIQRQRSAMLPIVSSGIEGRRVAIFNRADGGQHPMRGVEMKNTSGLQLLPGPVAVFDGAVYAGDAQVGQIAPGDKRLLSYAVDLETVALVEDAGQADIRKIRVVNGVFEQTYLSRTTTTYKFTSKDAKRSRMIIVEHPKMGGMELKQPQKPADETAVVYRFEQPLEPGKQAELKVVMEQTLVSNFAFADIAVETMASWSQSGKASAAVHEAFKELRKRQAAINQADRKAQELENERKTINDDQTRIRQNMGSIDRASDLYSRYVKKLTEQETRLEQLIGLIKTQQDEVNNLRQDLATFVSKLNVE